MKSVKNMSIGELAAYICSWLNANGIKCVLTGGACISIYSKNTYQSFDLDFIDTTFSSRKDITNSLKKIGFKEKNRYFIHKDTEFFVEFPPGPVSVGTQPVKDFKQMAFSTGELLLLTPTDSVKDRLAAFYYWDDKQALEQAILVSKNYKVNLEEIKKWSKAEGQTEKFKAIIKFLNTGKSKP